MSDSRFAALGCINYLQVHYLAPLDGLISSLNKYVWGVCPVPGPVPGWEQASTVLSLGVCVPGRGGRRKTRSFQTVKCEMSRDENEAQKEGR